MTKPGHALWKFTFHDTGGVYYRNSNKRAEGYFHDSEQTGRPFSIHVRNPEGGWNYVTDIIRSDTCQCGRKYTDTYNGREFRWRDAQFLSPDSVVSCIEIFTKPVLCQICYYSMEYREGRFCPKWVKERMKFDS